MTYVLTRSVFSGILSAMNATHRGAGQVTPAVCRVWERDKSTKRIVDAVIAWEINTRSVKDDGTIGGPETGRIATAADMEAVVAQRLAFEAEMRGAPVVNESNDAGRQGVGRAA